MVKKQLDVKVSQSFLWAIDSKSGMLKEIRIPTIVNVPVNLTGVIQLI